MFDLFSYDRIAVDEEVTRKRGDMTREVAEHVLSDVGLRAVRQRSEFPAVFAVGGYDSAGRLIEIACMILADGTLRIFHMMKMKRKIAEELDLLPEWETSYGHRPQRRKRY